MLLFTIFKTQTTLAAASSLLFFSSMRNAQFEAQGELLLEAEAVEILPVQPEKPAPAPPEKKEEE